ncbi:MAG TPA: hypothetical protein VFR85_08945 [Anaeromyxobacteraceae bacterium]|nr:hypothetical protein [Anaeromyxobacteraceae bacterium]
MAIDITKALFRSRTRTELLRTVLRDGVSDSLSGLARRAGLSQHTVAVEVKNLAAAGLVRVEAVGGADVVRANREHPAVGVLVQLLAVADATSSSHDDSAVRESLAYFGAPLRTRKRRQHFTLETTLARGLPAAKRDPAVLKAVVVVLLKNRSALNWPVLKEEARMLKAKHELEKVVELAADVSGRVELKVHVADLKDLRRKTSAFFIDDSVRIALQTGLPSSGRLSLAATKAAAAERERLQKMSAADRALLALDLGERLSALRRAHE